MEPQQTSGVSIGSSGSGVVTPPPSPASDSGDTPTPERLYDLDLSFENLDVSTAEKLKQILTDAVPLGTSYSVRFSDPV